MLNKLTLKGSRLEGGAGGWESLCWPKNKSSENIELGVTAGVQVWKGVHWIVFGWVGGARGHVGVGT